MDNILFYMALLACPLMLGVMFFMMKGAMGGHNKSNQNDESQQQIQKNMNDLMDQNKRLMQEMENIKRSR